MTATGGGAAGALPGDATGRRVADDARVARRPGVLSRELDGETILLDPDRGTYYALNEVGSRVWDLVAERPSVREILRHLEGEYAIDRASLARDVDRLLVRLADEGLIEITKGPGGGGQP